MDTDTLAQHWPGTMIILVSDVGVTALLCDRGPDVLEKYAPGQRSRNGQVGNLGGVGGVLFREALPREMAMG